MENKDDRILLRNNPVFVIGIACLLAILMFSGSLLAYLHSDTKKTIEQIQANNLRSIETPKELSLSAELNDAYLDQLETNIQTQISSHSDETDYSSAELTDSALGL